MKDKTSVHNHLNVFNSLMNELLGTGVKIDEEEQNYSSLFNAGLM